VVTSTSSALLVLVTTDKTANMRVTESQLKCVDVRNGHLLYRHAPFA